MSATERSNGCLNGFAIFDSTVMKDRPEGIRKANWVGDIETDLQMRARMSPLPVANTPPVGLGATEMTEFL
jgi:hypothetical protein